jgi:hypothetical protein
MSRVSAEKRDDALTICTVSFHNARHIALNWELVAALNKNAAQIKWIVAENTPVGDRDRLDFSDPRYRVILGAPPNVKVSYHHTEGLHRALELVTTRYLLILDPDFYIVRPNWWDEVRAHLSARKVAFFGSPWHPKFTDKYRYFPAVHCMFIDLAKVNLGDLDFRPWPGKREAISARVNSPLPLIRAWARLTLQHRWRESVDTGTRVYLRYANDPKLRSECLVPVYRLPRDLPGGRPPSLRSRLIEAVLPDSLCYIPKRRGYFTARGFREAGAWASMPEDWEEFMWRGEPFGFHVRRNSKKLERNEEAELAALYGLLRAKMHKALHSE